MKKIITVGLALFITNSFASVYISPYDTQSSTVVYQKPVKSVTASEYPFAVQTISQGKAIQLQTLLKSLYPKYTIIFNQDDLTHKTVSWLGGVSASEILNIISEHYKIKFLLDTTHHVINVGNL